MGLRDPIHPVYPLCQGAMKHWRFVLVFRPSPGCSWDLRRLETSVLNQPTLINNPEEWRSNWKLSLHNWPNNLETVPIAVLDSPVIWYTLQIPALRKPISGTRYFSRLQNFQTDYGAHPVSYSMRTGFLPRAKTAGAWSWSYPSSAEVKNEWSYTSSSLIYPYDL
jgi:hypothetical protein